MRRCSCCSRSGEAGYRGRYWTTRVLDSQAYAVTVADGGLLATDGGASRSSRSSGGGLAVHGADGTRLR